MPALSITEAQVALESATSGVDFLEDWRRHLEDLGIFIWIWNLTDDRVEFTPAWLDLMGYSASDVPTGSSWFSLVHPDELELVSSKTRACLDGEAKQFDYEFRLRRKDGLYQWVHARGKIIRPENSQAKQDEYFIGVYTDTAARHADQHRIRTLETRWNQALSGTGVGVWEWDIKTGEAFFSDEWCLMLDLDPRDIDPTIELWRELAHPEDLAKSDREIAAYINGEKDTYECECRVKTNNGITKWILDRGIIVERDEDGSPRKMIGTHDDITARKEQEIAATTQAKALSLANQDLEQFNYVAAHDLKEPLRAIKYLSQWIIEDLPQDVAHLVEKNAKRLQERADKLQILVDDLAAYSRAGRLNHDQIRLKTTGDIVEQTLDSIDGHSAEFDLSAVEKIAFETIEVALVTVLKNLLVNAIKHHDHYEPLLIKLSATQTKNMICWAVEDNGPGIVARHHERIFRMYQQLEPDHAQAGSGSGLAIVKRIVNAGNGQITVSSPIANSRGTRFSFSWPTSWPRTPS